MIDYQKLQLAHELASELARQNEFTFAIQVAIGYCGTINYMLKAYLIDEQYMHIDELITKLRGLVKQEPKYEIGQTVWFVVLSDNWNPIESTILQYDPLISKYFLAGTWFRENEIYPSKEALIEAQMEYWICLKNEEISTQESNMSMTSMHVNDALNYPSPKFEEITTKDNDMSEFTPLVFNCPFCSAKRSRRRPLLHCCNEYEFSLIRTKFEGEIKGFDCSESIRKHHELEDGEELCQHEAEPKINYSNPLNDICKKCGEFY